jgi:hypothetical protein
MQRQLTDLILVYIHKEGQKMLVVLYLAFSFVSFFSVVVD